MGSIREWGLKIKLLGESVLTEWGIVLTVILAVLGAFGLGRLSALTEARPLVTIQEAAAAGAPALSPVGMLVASKTGEVYYYPWCAGAAKITPEKQRWFQDEKAAKAAGYRPAKNCKGLES